MSSLTFVLGAFLTNSRGTDFHLFESSCFMASPSKKKLVLTGFGPFGQYKENPSSILVSRISKLGLPKELSENYQLVTTLLDVAYTRVDSYVKEDIKTENAHVIRILYKKKLRTNRFSFTSTLEFIRFQE